MDLNIFEVFSLIGTVAFALSGVFVAMEEEYDILGVLVLGLVTALIIRGQHKSSDYRCNCGCCNDRDRRRNYSGSSYWM